MPFGKPLGKTTQALAFACVLFVASVAVGLTAPADSPFSIVIRPVFLRLGVEIDVRLGSLHLHGAWSALAPGEASTKVISAGSN